MTMPQAAAALATILLGALAIVQVLLAAGRPIGALAWGGTDRVLPPRLRVASAITVPVYATFAIVLLVHADVLPGQPGHPAVTVGAWVAVAVFALGIPANALSRSRWERRIMLPASVVLATSALVVALAAG